MKKSWLSTIFVLSLVFYNLPQASAAVEDFVFSEIMYDPSGADPDREWVEVYNSATTSAKIVGGSVSNSLRFYDGSNHTLATPAFQGSMIISSQSYFILAQNAPQFKLTYPNYSGTLVEVSAMSLANTSETVAFRQGSSGSLFSSLTYDKGWGGNGNGKSLEKKLLTGTNDVGNWVSSFSDGGSPGEAYEEPPPIIYPTTVKINEFLPDPLIGEEWVELYNGSADTSANLNNWQLDDIAGGSSPQTFSATIPPGGYYLYYFSSSVLNNDGDSVRLIRPDAQVSDSINYSSSTKGFSWAFDGSVFAQTAVPTPGSGNTMAADPDVFLGSILEIKRLPLKHKISLTALVSAPENLLGDKDIYVWDASGEGIKISYSQNLDQSLRVGDKVKVSSTVEESYDEKYIKTEKVILLQKQASNVEETKIKTGELTEINEGRLVVTQGKLEEQSSDVFYLNDSSGRAKVFIKDSTGIIKIKMAVGEEIRVTGIVSQYGYLKNGESNYRILPRFQSDIFNLTQGGRGGGVVLGTSTSIKELPVTGFERVNYYYIGWALIFLGLSGRVYLDSKKTINCGCEK